MFNTGLYERTHILVGDAGIQALQKTNVFLAGVGGVGGGCAEALVRGGVGRITIADHDVVSASNKNRQLVALDSTVGKSKVEVLSQRLRDINPECEVTALNKFLVVKDMIETLKQKPYDFVVDCIDSVTCKVALLEAATRLKLRVYSSCGAGGRLDPSQVRIDDLYNTTNDGLARICRNALRKRGIGRGEVTVVFSPEKGIPPLNPERGESDGLRRAINGTISYMPPLFGLMLASAVIRCALNPKAVDESKAKLAKQLQKESTRQKYRAIRQVKSKKSDIKVSS